MKKRNKIKNCYIFTSGMVMSFDEKEQQIPDCQGFILEVADKLKENADKNTNFYFAKWKGWSEPLDFEWWFLKRKKQK
jgi:hypothetical protein